MAFPNKYLFYITNGTDYFYVDNAGAVANTVTPTPLVYAPDNWNEVSISFERGWTYYGLFRQYTSEFQFVKDGAKILRWAYYLSSGIEGELRLVIKKFNNTAAVYDYEDFIDCSIDFSTFLDSFDKVSVNLIESGFITKLKARENTEYNFDVQNNADVIWVKMHGIKLNCILNYTVTGAIPQAFTALILPLTEYYNTEGFNTQLTRYSVNYALFQSCFLANDTNIGSLDIDISTKLNFNAIMAPSNTVNGFVKLRYRMYQITPYAFVSDTVIYTSAALAPNTTTTINIDQIDTITFPANHNLEFQFYCDDGAGGGGTNDYEIDLLTSPGIAVSFNNRVPEGYIPALRSQKVFEELVDDISDGTTTATSTLLNTTYVDHVITSGDALRLLEGSKMKLTFVDFFRSINGVFSAAMFYNKGTDTVYIEGKPDVFDGATSIANIGNINDFSAKPLINEMFSKFTIGFPAFTYDEVNGKDEFNQTTEYLSPLTKVQQNKDFTSQIRADMYGIEYTRLNLTDKKSTDADTDNDTFFLHIESASAGTIPAGYEGAGEPYYELYMKPIDLTPGANYWEIENLQYPETAFNIFYSAKRALARWGDYISSLLFLQDNELIKFQASTKNNLNDLKLKTSEGSPVVVIDESANQFVSDYLPQLFYPIMVEIQFPDTATLQGLIDASPHGYLSFNYKGYTFEGFIIKIKTMPFLQQQSATLLLTTNNTLTDIVYP